MQRSSIKKIHSNDKIHIHVYIAYLHERLLNSVEYIWSVFYQEIMDPASNKLKFQLEKKSWQVFETAHVKKVLITYATSEGSGKPAHPPSLTRAIAVC